MINTDCHGWPPSLHAGALRGLELARGLRDGRLLRRRFTFSTDPALVARAPPVPKKQTPFFTVRRPAR